MGGPIVFIGMETSGELRRRFHARGIECYSGDFLAADDGGEAMAYSAAGLPLGRHLVGDVFATLDNMRATDLWPAAAIFHPTCTYLTASAEWAFADPDFIRFPGVGYHQKVKPGTLTGRARREARQRALDDFAAIAGLDIEFKVIENPGGAISTAIGPPSQIVQPYELGDDASKKTGFWFLSGSWSPAAGAYIPIDRSRRVPGRLVPFERAMGRPPGRRDPAYIERWANQSDRGQNRLPPADDRWKARSKTFPGIADAIVDLVIRQLRARGWEV